MNEAKHTPGPWRPHHTGATRVIANVPGHEGETHTICNTWSSPLSPPRTEAAANARLIAAAPDLLAVVEALMQAERDGYTGSLPHALILMYRDAHAKAKGGAS